MSPEFITLSEKSDFAKSLAQAADVLRDGGLVAFPTETVYGLGARADSPTALSALYEIKDRDRSKPFTVHIADPAAVDDYVPQPTGLASRLMRKAWPGPLTLVLEVADPAAAPVVRKFGAQAVDGIYHQSTVGVRCPDDPVARQLLREAAVPVVAASANLAGKAAPRTAEGVRAALDGRVDLILDNGQTRYGQPSTVVRVQKAGFEVLREGVFDARTLRRLGALRIILVCTGNTCRSPMAEAFCRQVLAQRLECSVDELESRGVYVESAGVFAGDGAPPSDGAARAMARRRIDLSGHRSRSVEREMIQSADHVFCMTPDHLESVRSVAPEAIDRIAMLDADRAIEDPIGSDDASYDACADTIATACRQRMMEIAL